MKPASFPSATCIAALAGLWLGFPPGQVCLAQAAPADGEPPPAPALGALSALRRLGPLGPAAPDADGSPFALAAALGYGFTEAVLDRQDRHHRVQGTLAGEWTALPALQIGLRLSGRYDRHQLGAIDDGDAAHSDDGWTGEPQLGARYAHAITPATLAGLALHVSFPGGQAPSIDPGAIGGELLAQAGHVSGSFAILGQLGYRLDRSAHAVPPPDRLSDADRVGLGVSAFDALLAGVAIQQQHDARTFYAELTLEALLGTGHPPVDTWPLRVGFGLRQRVLDALTGEIGLEVLASHRPRLDATAPLVEVPPRVLLLAGLLWNSPRPQPSPASQLPPATPAAAAGPALPPVGQLRCAVRSFGGVGIAASVRILTGPDVPAPAAPLHSHHGTFSIELAPGTYELVIEAPHFTPQRRTITVEKNGVTLLNADLRRSK
jgi:hypothetical protein